MGKKLHSVHESKKIAVIGSANIDLVASVNDGNTAFSYVFFDLSNLFSGFCIIL